MTSYNLHKHYTLRSLEYRACDFWSINLTFTQFAVVALISKAHKGYYGRSIAMSALGHK